MYEPNHDRLTGEMLKNWHDWRKESSKTYEQIAVLVAMAQHQAEILDISRFDIKDPRLHTFEVFCLSLQL